MTAIWHNTSGKWGLLTPVGFEDEAALHDLVEESPEMLPLAGNPQLAILGREVRLGGGYADLLAVEPSGRLAVIEIKLKTNPEARRAVVAQVLAYAAYLYGLAFEELESGVLGGHLRTRGSATIADAVARRLQTGTEPEEFPALVEQSLATGEFRLVIVLDEVPEELARVVAYLEAVSSGIVVDLVAVSAYQVGIDKVVVPQRVEAERVQSPSSAPRLSKQPGTTAVRGPDLFLEAIPLADEESQARLRWLADWALSLESEGVAELFSVHGRTRRTLQLRVPRAGAALVTIVTDRGGSLWPSRVVFRHAPNALKQLEAALESRVSGDIRPDRITSEVLDILADGYREAARNTT